MEIKFSVIIPSLNEEHYISHILNSLKNQTYKNFEVILVDTNSTDKTIITAQKFSKFFPLKILNSNIRNISHSRNLGAAKASGNYLFFIDADNYVFPTFLEKNAKEIKKNNYSLIIPAIVPNSKKTIYKVAYSFTNFFIRISRKINMHLSTGGNLIIKKHFFDTLNGFDEAIFVGEDHDIVKRACKNNAKTAFLNNPKVIFSVRRLEKEGFTMLFKYFFSTIYIIIFGKITRKIYNYEMGGDYFENQK
jgi:glycosyltransferase involved in cell wall biosynthesis